MVVDVDSASSLASSLTRARVKREAMARGLMCYPMGGTVDGQRGDHVLLAPPYIVDEEAVQTIAAQIRVAVDAAIAGAGK